MSRHDPVLQDDALIEALLAGDVPDDPVLGDLAAWRADVLEPEPAALAPVPAAVESADHVAPRPPASRSRRRAGSRNGARAGVRTRRVAAIGVGVGLLFSMGVSQAVAGSPVAPLQYVVARAVDFGEEVGSPSTSEAGERGAAEQTPTSPEVLTGRADAGALAPAGGEAAEPSDRSADDGENAPQVDADDPATAGPPRSEPGPPPPATPPTLAPVPDRYETEPTDDEDPDRDPWREEQHRDRDPDGRDGDGDRDDDRDDARDRDGRSGEWRTGEWRSRTEWRSWWQRD